MDDSPGRKSLGNDVWKESNVFDPELIEVLYSETKKHLEHNTVKYRHSSLIATTNCIIDCHGLSIIKNGSVERDPEFPYCIGEWNKFIKKIQDIMFSYCDANCIDKRFLSPHSCWAESSKNHHPNGGNLLDKNDDIDLDLNLECGSDLIHFKVIYFLKNPVTNFSLRVLKDGENIDFSGEENSLYVIPSSKYEFYNVFPLNTTEKINIAFDWYLHPKNLTMSSPAWKIPNKFNHNLNEDNIAIIFNKRLASFIEKRLGIESLETYLLSKIKEDLVKVNVKKLN